MLNHSLTHTHTVIYTLQAASYIPELSSIVTNDVLGGPIPTTFGLSTEEIITFKYCDGSTVTSFVVDTNKVADAWPEVKLTLYGPGV